jgi:hypothetical protein
MMTLKVAGYILSLSLSVPLMAQQEKPNLDQWKDVDASMGRSGQMQAGGVYKFAMPRRDLKVTRDGVTIAPQPTIDIDTAGVEKALGYTGKVNGGILQFSVPRMEKIVEGGMEIPPAMGTATAINDDGIDLARG